MAPLKIGIIMLDLKFIRENAELVKKGGELKRMRNAEGDVDRLLDLDSRKRGVQQKLQELQAEQNKASKELGPLMGQIKKEQDPSKKAELEAKVEVVKARPAATRMMAMICLSMVFCGNRFG